MLKKILKMNTITTRKIAGQPPIKSVVLILGSVFLLLLAELGLAQSPNTLTDYQANIQETIEKSAHKIIQSHLNDKEYILYVKVSATETQKATEDAIKSETKSLPFSDFTIKQSDAPLKETTPKSFLTTAVKFVLVFDESVKSETITLLKDVIQDRFSIYENVEITDSKSDFTRPITPVVPSDVEKLKIEREKTMLEVEKLKLELTKKELENISKEKPPEDPVEDLPQAQPDPIKPQVTSQLPAEKNAIEKYQFLVMGLLIGLAVIVAFFLVASGLSKGLIPMSSAIGSIGSSLEAASSNLSSGKSSVGLDTTVVGAGTVVGGAGTTGMTNVTSPTNQSPTAQNNPTQDPDSGSKSGISDDDDRTEEYTEFVKEVQDKIEVLASEGSFSFYREFTDLIENGQSILYAASIVVAVNRKTAEVLLRNISADQLDKLKTFMETEGNMRIARKFKRKALEEFYSKIALDEYLSSPILEIKEAEWLMKKSNYELSEIFVSLDDTKASQLAACFSPLRVTKILEATEDSENKVKIMSAVSNVSQVSESHIKPLFESLNTESHAKQEDQNSMRALIDETNYISTFMSKLSIEDKKTFVSQIDPQSELAKNLRKVYLPFETILKVPESLILDMFADRDNALIGLILFAAEQNIRNHILDLLPDIKKATVLDRLKQLDEDQVYRVKNTKDSYAAQEAISNYMIKLYNDGVLTLDNKTKEVA